MGYPSVELDDPQSAWADAMLTDRASERSIYIHVPFCRSRCTFCPFYYGSAGPGEFDEYVKLLAKELAYWGPILSKYPVNTVYFGGGTPSDMTPQQIELLLRTLSQKFNLTSDCEITLESRINGWTDDKISAAVSNGVNRFSLGVQTFNTGLRKAFGRTSDQAMVIETLKRLTDCNQASVTADILYGLPGQTLEMLEEDLYIMLRETGLSGFSFYRLHIHPRLVLHKMIEDKKLPPAPDEDKCFELFQYGEERMAYAGAKRISFKHFSFHPRERNLHNEISAWKNPCLPFGINAGGRLGNMRFKQLSNIADYRKAVELGEKPLESAGRFPVEYPAAAKIAGQLNCHMAISREITLQGVPESVKEKLIKVLDNELAVMESEGFLSSESHGSRLLTSLGRFKCAALATRLMNCLADNWTEGEDVK